MQSQQAIDYTRARLEKIQQLQMWQEHNSEAAPEDMGNLSPTSPGLPSFSILSQKPPNKPVRENVKEPLRKRRMKQVKSTSATPVKAFNLLTAARKNRGRRQVLDFRPASINK